MQVLPWWKVWGLLLGVFLLYGLVGGHETPPKPRKKPAPVYVAQVEQYPAIEALARGEKVR